MLSAAVNLVAILLSATTLAALALGLPAVGSLGVPAVEMTGAVGLHLQFAALALVALVTSRGWRKDHGRFRDGGWPTLRALAYMAPAATVAQIALGAAYRYRITGVIPHVTWAFAVAILLLMFGSFILTQAGVGDTLKRIAASLVAAVGLQVMLGVAALLGRTAGSHAPWTRWAAGAHLVAGAVVLGLVVILSAFVLRCAEPAPETGRLASDGTNP